MVDARERGSSGGESGLSRVRRPISQGFARFGGTFARFDGGAVAADVPDQLIEEVGFDQGFMHTLGQTALGEFGKGAFDAGLIGQPLPARESTDAPQGAIYRQALNQRDGGGKTENDFDDKSIGECAAIRWHSR